MYSNESKVFRHPPLTARLSSQINWSMIARGVDVRAKTPVVQLKRVFLRRVMLDIFANAVLTRTKLLTVVSSRFRLELSSKITLERMSVSEFDLVCRSALE